MRRSDRLILALAIVAGVTLCVIGVRFFIWPEAAAKFFGVGPRPTGTELHAVVAFRDVWLGALALMFAWLREWRALAAWFGFGALVCFADAALVTSAAGKSPAILFHTISGFACTALAYACWQRTP